MRHPLPVMILDDFFDDPDEVVKISDNLIYYPNDGRWPGKRSDDLYKIDQKLPLYIGWKVTEQLFTTGGDCSGLNIISNFQKIDPFHKDQYNKKNRGWVHHDAGMQMAGIIYLNKEPEKDTGLCFYRTKNGYYFDEPQYIEAKQLLYTNKEISDEQYDICWDAVHSQYVETIRIENVYNRLILFNGNNLHGVPTYGKKQTRLTLPFFIRSFAY